jgi:hypothetical protein
VICVVVFIPAGVADGEGVTEGMGVGITDADAETEVVVFSWLLDAGIWEVQPLIDTARTRTATQSNGTAYRLSIGFTIHPLISKNKYVRRCQSSLKVAICGPERITPNPHLVHD